LHHNLVYVGKYNGFFLQKLLGYTETSFD